MTLEWVCSSASYCSERLGCNPAGTRRLLEGPEGPYLRGEGAGVYILYTTSND